MKFKNESKNTAAPLEKKGIGSTFKRKKKKEFPGKRFVRGYFQSTEETRLERFFKGKE